MIERLRSIERDLDAGTYRPGPWQRLLREAKGRSRAERLSIAKHVSVVSDKLHLRGDRRTFSFRATLMAESVAAGMALLLLVIGIDHRSNALVLASAVILAATLQPLIKFIAGTALGIRYSYAYLLGVEPRFKMRYGSYLAASRWRRILFHLSGTMGPPLAFWSAALLAEQDLQVAASACTVLFWIMVGTEVVPLAMGLSGLRRFGAAKFIRLTSGGNAGAEIREASKS